MVLNFAAKSDCFPANRDWIISPSAVAACNAGVFKLVKSLLVFALAVSMAADKVTMSCMDFWTSEIRGLILVLNSALSFPAAASPRDLASLALRAFTDDAALIFPRR